MTFPTNMRHFTREEFKQPDMMNARFLHWLDRVRDRAGVVMEITDDGRADGDPEPSGSAQARSLHHRGCAVDFRTRTLNAGQLWRINAAIVALADLQTVGKVEWELVKGATEQHGHLGLDWTIGKFHELILASD